MMELLPSRRLSQLKTTFLKQADYMPEWQSHYSILRHTWVSQLPKVSYRIRYIRCWSLQSGQPPALCVLRRLQSTKMQSTTNAANLNPSQKMHPLAGGHTQLGASSNPPRLRLGANSAWPRRTYMVSVNSTVKRIPVIECISIPVILSSKRRGRCVALART